MTLLDNVIFMVFVMLEIHWAATISASQKLGCKIASAFTIHYDIVKQF